MLNPAHGVVRIGSIGQAIDLCKARHVACTQALRSFERLQAPVDGLFNRCRFRESFDAHEPLRFADDGRVGDLKGHTGPVWTWT